MLTEKEFIAEFLKAIDEYNFHSKSERFHQFATESILNKWLRRELKSFHKLGHTSCDDDFILRIQHEGKEERWKTKKKMDDLSKVLGVSMKYFSLIDPNSEHVELTHLTCSAKENFCYERELNLAINISADSFNLFGAKYWVISYVCKDGKVNRFNIHKICTNRRFQKDFAKKEIH